MKPFFAVLKKELKSYIDHPMAYVLAIVFLVINNFLYFRTSLVQEVASLRSMFGILPWVFLFFISALTMRTWAEETRENTLSVLLSYPVKIWQIILGKFVATSAFVSAMLLVTLLIPISLKGVGSFDWGVVFAQYLGSIFMVLAMVAVGQWASSLSKNQVVAFIISIAVLFVFFFIGLDFVILALQYPLSVIAQQLGLLAHFNAITRGVIDIRDVLYFITLAFVFLTLSYAWLTRMKLMKTSKEWRMLQTSTILVIVIAIVINLFGQSFTVRADLTKQNLYSLSTATKSTLKNLDDTVRITLYRSQKLPTQIELVSRDVQDILSDYQKFGGGSVDFSIVYPDQDDEAAQQAQANGVPAIRFNVVREDEFTLQEGYLGVVIEYLDEKEVIPFVQSIGDIEYRLTSSILALLGNGQKRLGVVSDFGGKQLTDLQAFSQQIQKDFLVEQIQLASDEENPVIPEIAGIDLLLIAAPTERFSEAALKAVEDYANTGGKILWMVSGIKVDEATLAASKNTTGLESILAKQGITLNQDLVADLAAHQTVNFNSGGFSYLLPYPFWMTSTVRPHVLAGNITQVVTSWSSSLSFDESDTKQLLLATTENAVHQTTSFTIQPDQLNTLTTLDQNRFGLAATVQDIENTTGGEAGRWVVLSSNHFLDDSLLQQHPTNLGLVLNSLDWLGQNEALLSIRTKSSQPATLVWESNGQQAWLKWGNIIGIPVLVVAFGALWIFKRRRKISSSH